MALAQATADDDPLAALRAVRRARAEMERMEAVLVRRSRNRYVTWSEIGNALGVSKQAVNKKHRGRRFLGGRP